MSEQKPIKIRAKAMWACLSEPNEMSGKYQLDLTNLSKAAVAALEGLGLEVRKGSDKKEDMGFYITCKSTQPIRLYDADGTELKGVRMGNGSEVTAVVGSYEWSFKNKKGKSAALKKLVVTDLIVYGGEGDDAVDVDSGVADLEEDEVL
jgi:hypothetical protein